MRNTLHFRTMECKGCVCDNCGGACTNCVRCYRAEYAEKDWDDYYETECEGVDGKEDGNNTVPSKDVREDTNLKEYEVNYLIRSGYATVFVSAKDEKEAEEKANEEVSEALKNFPGEVEYGDAEILCHSIEDEEEDAEDEEE